MKTFASLMALAATASAMELMDQYDSSISVLDIADDLHSDMNSLTRNQVASVASLLLSISSGSAGPVEAVQIEQHGDAIAELEKEVSELRTELRNKNDKQDRRL